MKRSNMHGLRGSSGMMRKIAILAVVLILAVVVCLIMVMQGNTKDNIKVGIRSNATSVYDSDGLNITWVVENESTNEVRFDKGKIAQITVNGEPYAFEEDVVLLKPNEKYSVDINIPYPIVRKDGSNTIKIIATTENGTVATYKETFRQ